DRRIRDAKFFCHDITLEEAALVPAIFFWPGHTDPAVSADTFAEIAIVRVTMPRPMRIERAFGDFFGVERTHLSTQSVAFRRQADLIELQMGGHRAATIGQNSSAPRLATRWPSSAAQ